MHFVLFQSKGWQQFLANNENRFLQCYSNANAWCERIKLVCKLIDHTVFFFEVRHFDDPIDEYMYKVNSRTVLTFFEYSRGILSNMEVPVNILYSVRE